MNVRYHRTECRWGPRSTAKHRAVAWSILLLAIFGCREEQESGVEVRVCGDLVTPDEIDSIRHTVYNEDRTEAWSGLVELQTRGGSPGQADAGSPEIPAPPSPDIFRSRVIQLPLVNPGAEEGVEGWTIEEGVFESLESGECSRGNAYAGERFFSVGGACSGTPFAQVSQRVDITEFARQIDAETATTCFGGYLRDRKGKDRPAMMLRFIDRNDVVIEESESLGSKKKRWNVHEREVQVPRETRSIELVLSGTRSAGPHNDSYFDDLFMALSINGQACDEVLSEAASETSESDITEQADVDVAHVETVDLGVPDVMPPTGETVSFTGRVPDGHGNTWVRVQGLKDGVVVVVSETRPGRAAMLSLDRSCLSVRCAVGQTCMAGECQLVPVGGQCH